MKFDPLKDLETGLVDSTKSTGKGLKALSKGDTKGFIDHSTKGAKQFFDPGGLFGGGGGDSGGDPGAADREAGMAAFMAAIQDFEKNGNSQYNWLGDLTNIPQLGNTEMGGIAVDPRLKELEMSSLRDMEQISKDGLSARDQADLAQLENQVNRQNSGRQGAIQQNMAARGMGGSGLEMVAQMQAAQDATERQALASLEKAAMAQDGRRNATAQLGAQAGQMSNRDFQQQAQRAAAQDAINRFNVANQTQTQMYNHQGRQGTSNQNTAQNNNFQSQVMGAKQGGAQMQYNSGSEASNRDITKNANKGNIFGGALSGAAAGAPLGPWGMAGGAAIGVLSQQQKMYDGGQVPGQAQVPGDHPANDTVPTLLSPGEVVVPRTVAQNIPGSDPVEAIARMLSGRTKQTHRK